MDAEKFLGNQIVQRGKRGVVDVVGNAFEEVGRVVGSTHSEEDKDNSILLSQSQHSLFSSDTVVGSAHTVYVGWPSVCCEDDNAFASRTKVVWGEHVGSNKVNRFSGCGRSSLSIQSSDVLRKEGIADGDVVVGNLEGGDDRSVGWISVVWSSKHQITHTSLSFRKVGSLGVA